MGKKNKLYHVKKKTIKALAIAESWRKRKQKTLTQDNKGPTQEDVVEECLDETVK